MATDRSIFSTRTQYSSSRAPTLPRAKFDPHALLILLTLFVLPGMGWTYFATLKPITLSVDQFSAIVTSNQTTIAGVLSDLAVPLAPEDVVSPSLDAAVSANQSIVIRRAQPIVIQADGETLARRTQAKTIGDALAEAGILLKPFDRVWIGSATVEPVERLARPNVGLRGQLPTLELTIQRAVPMQVDDNGVRFTVYTTAPTLGEALRQAGYVIYLGDSVTPDLGTPIAPGWQVFIRRSRAVAISADGRIYQTRTRGTTIADVLKDEAIVLRDKDYTDHKPEQALIEGMTVNVIRVREETITESEAIPYETLWQADASLEIDDRQLMQSGVEGVKKRNIMLRFENGREARRTIEKEWIDTPPVTQIFSYGTKIVKRDLTLPNGQIVTYWRKIRMLATSYTAATSGKARNHPTYGITATGMPAGVGVVAVDPRVVNLRTRVYVPDYGMAIAGDTGGGIKGRRIDLGYDEWNLKLWLRWVDIYVLDPPPPTDQIHYLIPDTPRERASASR